MESQKFSKRRLKSTRWTSQCLWLPWEDMSWNNTRATRLHSRLFPWPRGASLKFFWIMKNSNQTTHLLTSTWTLWLRLSRISMNTLSRPDQADTYPFAFMESVMLNKTWDFQPLLLPLCLNSLYVSASHGLGCCSMSMYVLLYICAWRELGNPKSN